MSPISNVSEPEFSQRSTRAWLLLAWIGGTIAAALVLAVVFVFAYAEYAAWQQRKTALGQVIQLLNYNISKGHLELVPPTADPVAVPATPVAPAPVPKK